MNKIKLESIDESELRIDTSTKRLGTVKITHVPSGYSVEETSCIGQVDAYNKALLGLEGVLKVASRMNECSE